MDRLYSGAMRIDRTNKRIIINEYIQANEARYRRYYHLPVESFDPGNSGATWIDADANTIGGYQLNAVGEELHAGVDIHSDWDGESDLEVELYFEVNVDNTGGLVTDTVDIKAACYYKGVGETATKSQTIEVATVVGQSAQYKMFKVEFIIDWDALGNVVEAGDILHIHVNLETDTSEVDDIIINAASYHYSTTHIGIESGDT